MIKKSLWITVIVTCYNVQNYIEQCLNSIVGQKYTQLEIIIVNDGSTDNTLKIIQEFQKNDKRILIVDQINQGVSASRNNALKISTKEYIVFVDGDDWLSLNAIENTLPFIETYDMVCFSYFKEYPGSRVFNKLKLNNEYTGESFQRRLTGLINEELKDPSQLDNTCTVWGKIYKSTIINNQKLKFVNLDEIGTWEDGLFNWDYLNFAKNIRVVNEPYYHYRKFNNHSITSIHIADFCLKRNNLFLKLKAKLNEFNKGAEFFQAINNRICLSIIGTGLVLLNSKNSVFQNYLEIKRVRNSDPYRNAFADFDLKYFPLHWKLFFFFAKYRFILPLYVMLIGIKKIINR